MTLRYTMAGLVTIGSLAVASSCASAGPLSEGRFHLVSRSAGYELQVLVDEAPAASYPHGGESYVLGQLGARYTLRVVNHSGRRIEAVVSVDGRDVIDGRPADFRTKRGYLVPAWGQIDIDGWRLSTAEAAAFRFSTVASSYAARTGSAREVGVIGAAIFPERDIPRPPPRPLELPYRGPSPPPPSSPRDEAPAPPAASADADSGRAGSAPRSSAPNQRSGLGTEFGEAVSSPVYEVAFLRANPSRPSALLGVRYNDHDGLVAMGIDVDAGTCAAWPCDRETELRQTADPFPVVDRRFAPPPPCWGDRRCGR